MLSVRPLVALALGSIAVLAACGGGNAASQIVRVPSYAPAGQTKCGVARSQSRPLIVEWSSSDRMELESQVKRSIIAVHYVGCEMDVLERCTVPGAYRYTGGTRKEDRVVIDDEDSLYTNLPVGAAKLEGQLSRSGRLTVAMNLVGRYESERAEIRDDELRGDCTGATHFIYGLTVGAFDFYAGGEGTVSAGATVAGLGAGGASKAERQTLSRDGDIAACAKASEGDKGPPTNCGAMIRIEVAPITSHAGAAPEPAATVTKPAAPWVAPPPPPSEHTTCTSDTSVVPPALVSSARALAVEGVKLQEQGDCTNALDRLHKASLVVLAPTISLHEAQCLATLGRRDEALAAYLRLASCALPAGAPPAFVSAVEQAGVEYRRLLGR